MLCPPGTSYLSQREIHQSKTSSENPTQTVSSFPPTLLLACSALGKSLFMSPQTYQSCPFPTCPHMAFRIHMTLLQCHLLWSCMRTISLLPPWTPTHYSNPFLPSQSVFLPSIYCWYFPLVCSSPCLSPLHSAVGYRLHEMRDSSLLLEDCTSSS